MLMLFFALTAPAAAPSPVGTWVLSEGWTGSTLTLVPLAQADEDDRILLVFEEDGRVTWRARWPVDPSAGCSNSFGGFSGTWSGRGVELVEWTRGGESFSSVYVIGAAEEGVMLRLDPVR